MIRSPFHNGFAQPQIGALVNPGHPLGAHLVAGWVFRDYAREIILGNPLTDSYSTGSDFVNTRTGEGLTFPEGTVGFAAGGNARLDNLLSGFSVVMASTPSLQAGWIVYRNTSLAWEIGSANVSGDMRMRYRDSTDYDYAAGFASGQTYTMGWVHENSNARFYVDGVLKSTVAATAAFAANTTSTQIGDNSGTGEKWGGKAAYLYIFSVPLQAHEMMLLHQDPYCLLRPTPATWRLATLNAAAAGGGGTTTRRYSLSLTGVG